MELTAIILPAKTHYHLGDEIRAWCTASFGKGLWFNDDAFKDPTVMWIVDRGLTSSVKWTFRNPEHATMFKLRWS
jgi:hypothetical protein